MRWENEGGSGNPYDLEGGSKRVRLNQFLDALDNAPVASSYEEARRLVDNTLNSVENRTGIPYNPDSWRTDGRMYV